MITETFLQLLKEEAANLLQVGSDRIKVEYKDLILNLKNNDNPFNSISGLKFVLNINTVLNMEGLLHIQFMNGDSRLFLLNNDMTSTNSQSFQLNMFCDEIIIIHSGEKEFSCSYLSFEKF